MSVYLHNLGITCNHYHQLTDEETESGRLAHGHTAHQGVSVEQDTLALPSILITDRL